MRCVCQGLVELSLLFCGEGTGDPSLTGVHIDLHAIRIRDGVRQIGDDQTGAPVDLLIPLDLVRDHRLQSLIGQLFVLALLGCQHIRKETLRPVLAFGRTHRQGPDTGNGPSEPKRYGVRRTV